MNDVMMVILVIHCTHGFNRTGFLICAYLIESNDWSLEAALNEFRTAREPGIYKQDYLDDLHRRFGDATEEAPQAPELPEWCYGKFTLIPRCNPAGSHVQLESRIILRSLYPTPKNLCK